MNPKKGNFVYGILIVAIAVFLFFYFFRGENEDSLVKEASVSGIFSSYIEDIRTSSSLEELRSFYTFRVPDGSLDKEILSRLKELGLYTPEVLAEFKVYRATCNFDRLDGPVFVDTVSYGEWTIPFGVAGKKFISCAEGNRFLDRREDLLHIVEIGSAGDNVGYRKTVEFRLNAIDPNPQDSLVLWLRTGH